MKPELVVALIAGAVSLITAGFAAWASHKSNDNAIAITQLQIKEQQRQDAEKHQKEMSYYSEPLARSAYELKNRLFNILHQNLIDVYLSNGDKRTKAYVVNHTVFVIAQYMCWTEIVRRDIQYIDTGQSKRTRDLLSVQASLANTWSTDRMQNRLLRLFSGEQEQVGESLRQANKQGAWECMGYGAFLKAFPLGSDPLIDALRADINTMTAANLGGADKRLSELYDGIKKLLDLLDPDKVSFPQYRTDEEKGALAN